jgi:integrase
MKRSRRHQRGYVFRKGSFWYLRYYDREVQPDGTFKQLQKCRQLVEFGGDYRSKSSVRVLADEFLAPLNNGTMSPASTMTLNQFIEQRYLPYVESEKERSTYAGYKNSFHLHIEKHGDIPLRDVRTLEIEEMLKTIAHEFDTAKTTIQHDKQFLSGVFRYAKRQGVTNTENPVRDAVLPKCKETVDTHAYSLEDELMMICILPEPASTIVAVAAWTGLRKGELRGGAWECYTGDMIYVAKSVWRNDVKAPKTKASKAPVPVIAQLTKKLDEYRELCGSPEAGWMFSNSAGNPLDLDRLVSDVIRPALTKAGIAWHGWHAYRRGLATNLHRLGVQDKVIQAILRHSNVSVTQRAYIKTVDSDAVIAMQKLEHATNMQLEATDRKSTGRLPIM